ncbi:hypothetical protein EVAR_55225_1 [Eumeta japonica]|uniref:Uncharacterized protein n=1 Tax=Eumeta variegata TaxID=151549 RepID=A0A4C1ZSF8_EUMVA|nr:hypothetical protein EVAR_55225_1 [Eumeta japonica]
MISSGDITTHRFPRTCAVPEKLAYLFDHTAVRDSLLNIPCGCGEEEKCRQKYTSEDWETDFEGAAGAGGGRECLQSFDDH